MIYILAVAIPSHRSRMAGGEDVLKEIFQTDASRFEKLGAEFDLGTVSLDEKGDGGGGDVKEGGREQGYIQSTLFGGRAGNAFLACGKADSSLWRRSSNSEYLDQVSA